MLVEEVSLKVVALKTAPSPLTLVRNAVFGGSPKHLRGNLGSARNTVGFRSLRYVLLLTATSVLLGASAAEAGLKIYHIRHVEGGHNVAKDWADVPKDQWPAYVGNPNVFTPKGKIQQAAVAGKLKTYHFDFIGVSPMWRCRHTILPYLKETGAKGEIWPELREL